MSALTSDQARAYMHKLLDAMRQAGGSDLFIASDFPPSLKADGQMKPLTAQKLTPEVTRTLAEAIGKMNRYTSLGVPKQVRSGAASGYAKAFFRASWAFFKAYVLQRGFLDGGPGLVISVLRFENSFYKHVKLIEHRQAPDPSPPA